ncbi:MAG TPA: transcriptional repressor NrdR [Bacteroidetes bacterium]|nr:transcriptional repressor NrdR [Bacteroidota bacterium]
MRCPFCGTMEDRVIDSRPGRDGRAIRRRRECLSCGRRFTTYEYVEEVALHVVKRDGRSEPYDRNKLIRGVKVAAIKLPVTIDQIDNLVSRVERKLYAKASKEVSSRDIGRLVMAELKGLDPVAYIRYASVYRRFEDVGEFAREVRKLS